MKLMRRYTTIKDPVFLRLNNKYRVFTILFLDPFPKFRTLEKIEY